MGIAYILSAGNYYIRNSELQILHMAFVFYFHFLKKKNNNAKR